MADPSYVDIPPSWVAHRAPITARLWDRIRRNNQACTFQHVDHDLSLTGDAYGDQSWQTVASLVLVIPDALDGPGGTRVTTWLRGTESLNAYGSSMRIVATPLEPSGSPVNGQAVTTPQVFDGITANEVRVDFNVSGIDTVSRKAFVVQIDLQGDTNETDLDFVRVQLTGTQPIVIERLV